MIRHRALFALLLLPASTPLLAQDAGGFAILHEGDTVAVERFERLDVHLAGNLIRVAGPTRERIRYQATLVEDESTPLVEFSVWREEDPDSAPARQSARVIFKDDSVAVDDASRSSAMTRLFATERGAIPYLNLSLAFLELSTRRFAASGRDTLTVPFFNLGGGQTVAGRLRRIGADSATVQIGGVEFRLAVDRAGRIRGGSVPSQGLRITRVTLP